VNLPGSPEESVSVRHEALRVLATLLGNPQNDESNDSADPWADLKEGYRKHRLMVISSQALIDRLQRFACGFVFIQRWNAISMYGMMFDASLEQFIEAVEKELSVKVIAVADDPEAMPSYPPPLPLEGLSENPSNANQ